MIPSHWFLYLTVPQKTIENLPIQKFQIKKFLDILFVIKGINILNIQMEKKSYMI